MKAGYDARMRMKAEKEEIKRLQQEEIQKDEEFRKTDLEGWIESRRRDHQVRISFSLFFLLLGKGERDRVKSRKAHLPTSETIFSPFLCSPLLTPPPLSLSFSAPFHLQTAINKIKDRKRMKEMLSDRKSLAAQTRMKSITTLASDQPIGKKKRKRGNEEDNFGEDDTDWAVYREIVRSLRRARRERERDRFGEKRK